jgi:methyl-accepting chemotaxis protein
VVVTIGQLEEVTTMIAAAVEEQSATTREIAANVQTVTATGNQTTIAMKQVVDGSNETGTVSQQVLKSAGSISVESDRLRGEVDQFLAALRDTTGNRRHFERISGNGARAVLTTRDHAALTVVIKDLSRGGASLVCDWSLEAGMEVTIALPGAAGPVPGRAVRSNGRELTVVFRQNAETLVQIDSALAAVEKPPQAA